LFGAHYEYVSDVTDVLTLVSGRQSMLNAGSPRLAVDLARGPSAWATGPNPSSEKPDTAFRDHAFAGGESFFVVVVVKQNSGAWRVARTVRLCLPPNTF
jgi:hypothetical protein